MEQWWMTINIWTKVLSSKQRKTMPSKFKNIDTESFIWKYDWEKYLVKAWQTTALVTSLAEHLARQLAFKMITREWLTVDNQKYFDYIAKILLKEKQVNNMVTKENVTVLWEWWTMTNAVVELDKNKQIKTIEEKDEDTQTDDETQDDLIEEDEIIELESEEDETTWVDVEEEWTDLDNMSKQELIEYAQSLWIEWYDEYLDKKMTSNVRTELTEEILKKVEEQQTEEETQQ